MKNKLKKTGEKNKKNNLNQKKINKLCHIQVAQRKGIEY